MGANLLFKCPVNGCEYEEGFRLGMGQEDDPTAHNACLQKLREEHLTHVVPVVE